MKKIVLLSFSFACLFASAQNIKIESGKTFKITSIVNITGEQMGQEMKSDATTITTLKIDAIEDKLYKATATTLKMTMQGSMMGQDISFDSDKKEDMDSQIGQMLGGALNKPIATTIDKTTGEQKEVGEVGEANMQSAMGGGKASDYFFVLPKEKKIGDKWTTSTDQGGMKTITNYELQILNSNTATISFNGTIKGSSTNEANGMSMEMTVDTKSNGSFVVDINTGIVKQNTNTVETTGTMEVMGQSIPINNKTITTMVIE